MEPRAERILSQIKTACMEIFAANLVGLYVHGSLAFECFNWEKSDIDFLIVTRVPPSLREKERLIEELLRLDKLCPPKGMEMSLVLEQYCREFLYPTPFELHFSNAHKQKCLEDLNGYCLGMNGVDPDLAAHFTVVRKCGITLWGEKVEAVFGPVPKADYLDSIKGDIENAAVEIEENPVYILLNLCRVLAYIRDDTVLSKQQGAAWGLAKLPSKYGKLLHSAAESYRGAEPFSADVEAALPADFAEYMLAQIFKE